MAGFSAKRLLLLLGDLAALYASLFVTLWIRAPRDFTDQLINYHLLPFSIIFLLWVVLFYIAGLYDLRRLRNDFDFFKTLFLALFTAAIVAILFFYLIPIFGIAPKTNFFIFLAIFTVIEIVWRPTFNRLLGRSESLTRIMLLGDTATAQTIDQTLVANPQLGYKVAAWLKSDADLADAGRLREQIGRERIDVVLVPTGLKRDPRVAAALYHLVSAGIPVMDIPLFYERIFRKVPIEELEHDWFLDHLTRHQLFYDPLRRGIEFVAALLLQIVLLPFEAVIAFAIKLTSRGPIIYRQRRVGLDGRHFTLYKFRTMRIDAEAGGAQWSQAADPRVTPVGRFLRATHLDELPQLINILKGELSFIGPRPERPEFVELLMKEVPYYEIRTVATPGVTGWAQVSYKYGSSVDDTREKLRYDLYYLKNRSALLDLVILLKTLKTLFIDPHGERR